MKGACQGKLPPAGGMKGSFNRQPQLIVSSVNTADEINARFGLGALRFGVAQPGGRWETKFLRRSRRYTTCIDEVLHVA